MNVWWMLKDMVGDNALKAALHNYTPADDKDPSYVQKLIQAQTHRDLEWFFDDWVYRDRGLPDFKVDSVYPRQLVNGGYMVTVTVENLGTAGAEVPVTLHMGNGEASQRLMVPGRSKASVRIQAATMPQEVTVNGGSVPESDMSNNKLKLEPVPSVR
jgi:aminopeptidase N